MMDGGMMDGGMMDGGMMDGGMSSHRKFAAPIGLGLRAPIQIMSGPDDLARMVWPGLRFSVMPTI
jgi:hypothetical protein